MKKEKDIIIVFYGGAMRGVFGAGVATHFQEIDLYPRIHSVYGSSCGAHNAAYFLAKDSSVGSSIYYDDLIDSFISKKVGKFFYRLFLSIIKRDIELEKGFDIDYLIEIEKNRKKLDVEMIAKSDIGFFIRAFDVDLRKEQYLPCKTDILNKLKASSAATPFYPELVRIGNRKYSDGDILSKIIDPYLEGIISSNSDKKIFLVFNNPIRSRLSLMTVVKNFIWTLLLAVYFRKPFVFKKLRIFSERRRLKRYCKFPNVKIIEPDLDLPLFCTEREKLLELYSSGIEKAELVMVEEGII